MDRLLDTSTRQHLQPAESAPPSQRVPATASDATQRDLFRKIFEYSNDAIFILDPVNDRIRDANPRASQMLGYSAAEIRHLAISAAHPSEMPRLLAFTSRVQRDGSGWTDELTCLTKHGVQLAAEISASATTIDNQPCVIAMVRDIRERKAAQRARETVQVEMRARDRRARDEAEQALLHLRHQHELILNAAGDGIYGIDSQGRTTFANPAAIDMLGWTASEIIGKPAHDFHHHSKPDGSPYPHEECPIYAAFHDGKVHRCDDETFWHKDGRGIPVEYTSTPICEGDKIVGAVVVFRDITQRKTAESALRRLHDKERLAAVGEFAATIAHEVRSPLSTIGFALDYLDTVGQKASAQKRLELAASELERLQRLLNELLLFAKPQALRKRELDLDKLINDTLIGLQGNASTATRHIRYLPPSSASTVAADEDKLKQVLINLLSNACEATGPNGTVAISVLEPPGEAVAVIEIVNPGTISADILDRITEPFFTTKPHGSGLGLAIVKRILEAHGGTLSMRCDCGPRTVASVSLPARRSV
ncbi:MAG: PAS domain S-box protein [Gammaproteobacteria bacterium]|nr:PAS domain S-box protein [Gammaproteobacteria bacterium]